MSAPSMGAIAPDILVAGTPLSDAILNQLSGMRIRSSFGLPARTTLRFADIGYVIATGSTFTLGTEVKVQLAGGSKLFSGEVTGIDMQLDRGVPDLVVVCDDVSYKMALGNRARSFTQVTYSDIVRTITQENGLLANVDASTAQFDYVVQADSDFGFVSELAERMGYDWWVADGQLNFRKPDPSPTGPTVTVGEDLRQFSVRASALHPGATTVTGWGVDTKTGMVSVATAGQVPLPNAALVRSYANVSRLERQSKLTTSAENPMITAEADVLAARAVGQWASAAVTAKGTALINPAIKIGGSVSVAEAGPASGKYYVTEVEHTYSTQGFETRFVAGDRRPSGLVDTLTSGKHTSFRRDGLVIGIVTAVGNSQGSAGDIKVKYPGLDSKLESGWGRVLIMGGGAKRGITFTPEVNDEVMVGFENGDPRRPVILGGLFNGKDVQPAFTKDGSMIGSRQLTSRLGHTFEFGDGSGPDMEYIALTLEGAKHSVKLSKAELAATVPAGVPISLTSGTASIEIAKDGSITIAGKKITLKSETDVEISGLNITSKASVKAAVSGTQIEIKANAQAEMSASGPVMIKGATVMIN